jgi:hypothetical protein
MGLKAGGFDRERRKREREKGRDGTLRLDNKIVGEERDLGFSRAMIRDKSLRYGFLV